MMSQRTLPRFLQLSGMAWLLIAFPSIAVAKDKAGPELSGTWKLNVEKSESLQDKLARMEPRRMPEGGPPMGGGGPMGGGPPMGGMGGGRPRGIRGHHGSSDSDPMTDPVMSALARPPLVMVIEQNNSRVIVGERGRTLRTLLLHGERADDDSGDLAQMRARWKGARLEAKGKSPDGRKLEESYRISKDRKSLTVIVTGEGMGGQSIELERVYDRYQDEPRP